MDIYHSINSCRKQLVQRTKRNLIFALYDMKARYADSFLGILWAFLLPAATVLCFWFVFEKGLRTVPSGAFPYSYWFSAGYVPWLLISDALGCGCRSCLDYSFLLKKIPLDAKMLPDARLISCLLVHFLLLSGLLIQGFLLGKTNCISLPGLLYYLFSAACLMMCMVRLLSVIAAFWKDMVSIVQALLQILFWLTPIVWNKAEITSGIVRALLRANVFAYIVNGYRDSLLGGKTVFQKGAEAGIFWGTTAVLYLASCFLWKKAAAYMADEV